MDTVRQVGRDIIDVFKYHGGEIVTYIILVFIVSAIFHFTGEIVSDIYG